MAICVQFMSLFGEFRTVKTELFATHDEAKKAIISYATSGGFTNVKSRGCVLDCESVERRYTATTPGGRSGRNVAFADEV